MITYKAGIDIGRTPYHLRRLNYLNTLKWDDETEFLNVRVNNTEVQFDFWNEGTVIHLINQPQVGDTITLTVEPITFLD